MRKFAISVLTLLFVSTYLAANLYAAQKGKGIGVVIKTLSGKKIQLYKESHALVIGASNYTGLPKLECVPNEIDQVEVALKKQGFQVKKVMNPKSYQLKKAFEDFINKYGYDEDNRLLFFFSGHGYSRKGGKRGYLVPVDAPNPEFDKKGFMRKALGMGQVLTWSRQLESKHALFLFDSCFSGTIFKAKAIPKHPPHISAVTSQPVRQFISAGSAGEEVPASSVFTPSFIRALKGEGDLNEDGYITGTEMGMYLHEKVLSYERGQTPQYGKIKDPDLDEGDFVFQLASSPLASAGFSKVDPGIESERKRLERERRDLERQEVEIEKKKLEAMRKRLEAEKTKLAMGGRPKKKEARETGHDGRFIAYSNGTVLDTRTYLMWASKDNGKDITWKNAKRYCENYRGGGYTDWRMPTYDELARIYDKSTRYKATQRSYKVHLTELIQLSTSAPWAFETRGSEAACFNFYSGSQSWDPRSYPYGSRTLPVRVVIQSGEDKEIDVSLKKRVVASKPRYQTGGSSRETGGAGRFIAYANGTVLDSKTGLMWASRDNGSDINWSGAKSYCENYKGAGYTDWRMPTINELAALYDSNKSQPTQAGYKAHLTELIQLTTPWTLSSDTRGSDAAYFGFSHGGQNWRKQSNSYFRRALPVRSGN